MSAIFPALEGPPSRPSPRTEGGPSWERSVRAGGSAYCWTPTWQPTRKYRRHAWRVRLRFNRWVLRIYCLRTTDGWWERTGRLLAMEQGDSRMIGVLSDIRHAAFAEDSDDELAAGFVEQQRDNVRYVAPWDRWFVWNGKRWASDQTKWWRRAAPHVPLRQAGHSARSPPNSLYSYVLRERRRA